MTLADILIGICVLFFLFVGICALLLCVVGFSFGQGVAITLAFLFFGVWNPVGWAVLIWCIFSRRAQVKRAMLESQSRYAVLEQPSSGLRARATTHSPATRELTR
jgi:hypothetical protein